MLPKNVGQKQKKFFFFIKAYFDDRKEYIDCVKKENENY